SASGSSSNTAYYCTLANPFTWVTPVGESAELSVVTSSSCPTTTTYHQVRNSDEAFELNQLFEPDDITQLNRGSESSQTVEYHNMVNCSDQYGLNEKIEVIELDASQFESELTDPAPNHAELSEMVAESEEQRTNKSIRRVVDAFESALENESLDQADSQSELVDLGSKESPDSSPLDIPVHSQMDDDPNTEPTSNEPTVENPHAQTVIEVVPSTFSPSAQLSLTDSDHLNKIVICSVRGSLQTPPVEISDSRNDPNSNALQERSSAEINDFQLSH
ncbi:unnamed protein product, partial [Echinostoma caproni]|uniref:Ig-like domain-containing protein n=1 Tax=Echinostoma caproni TaxID=27848 RepID=A0A183B955_9TREM